jgi:hypothetical protein
MMPEELKPRSGPAIHPSVCTSAVQKGSCSGARPKQASARDNDVAETVSDDSDLEAEFAKGVVRWEDRTLAKR